MKPSTTQKRIFPQNTTSGFTLLEMIVAVSVFIVAILIIIGSLVSLNEESRKARTVRIVTDNLSAAVDSMSRNIRMGSSYHCGCGVSGVPSTPGDATFPTAPRNCAMTDTLGNGGDVCMAFEPEAGLTSTSSDQVIYRLSGNRIERSTDGGVSYLPLTAPEIKITDLHFYVYGTSPTVDQPVVTMTVRGTAALSVKTTTDFNIQTTIDARTPNF